jgi:hypothetical protein
MVQPDPVIGGPANELQVVRGTINMNPGVDPYCRAFGGPRPMNFGGAAYLTILCCGGLCQVRAPALAMAGFFFCTEIGITTA